MVVLDQLIGSSARPGAPPPPEVRLTGPAADQSKSCVPRLPSRSSRRRSHSAYSSPTADGAAIPGAGSREGAAYPRDAPPTGYSGGSRRPRTSAPSVAWRVWRRPDGFGSGTSRHCLWRRRQASRNPRPCLPQEPDDRLLEPSRLQAHGDGVRGPPLVDHHVQARALAQRSIIPAGFRFNRHLSSRTISTHPRFSSRLSLGHAS